MFVVKINIHSTSYKQFVILYRHSQHLVVE
jgi:hypothetical protein